MCGQQLPFSLGSGAVQLNEHEHENMKTDKNATMLLQRPALRDAASLQGVATVVVERERAGAAQNFHSDDGVLVQQTVGARRSDSGSSSSRSR